jgi:hypothetical protein
VEFHDRAPGLTKAQSQARAERMAALASAFRRQIEVDVPGDVTIKQHDMVSLTGTESSFDGS